MNEQSLVEEVELPANSERVNVMPSSDEPEGGAVQLKKKKKKKQKVISKHGSIRGVETMFRGSYTTQLALTSLADNKANMMISINGLILSVVLAGSATSVNDNPYLLLPLGILLISSLTAIFLAIRAARPNVYNAVAPTKEDFFTGKANALFFGHFAALSPNDYFEVVSKIMESRKLTYQLLTQHTHGLGVGLVKKFKLLQWAYTVFITGLGASIVMVFVIYILLHQDFMIKPIKAAEQKTKLLVNIPKLSTHEFPVFTQFKSLESVNEVSGIQQLPDGRFLVINDEKDHPMDILTLDNQGDFTAQGLYPDKLFEKKGAYDDFRKLADLEGIDTDKQGYIYAVTSHSANNKGETSSNRKKLVRFKIDDEQIIEPIVISNLAESLAKKQPFLEKALVEMDSKSEQSFNIEGMSLNSTQDKLLFGLRSPLIDKKAVVFRLDNVKDVFSHNAPLEISDKVAFLDLGGNGIRSMNYFPLLNGYLVVSGPVGKSDNVNFNLWLWCADNSAVQPVTVEGLVGFEETEGIAPMLWQGQPRVIMMTDGTLDDSTIARYIILKYEQLQIKKGCSKG